MKNGLGRPRRPVGLEARAEGRECAAGREESAPAGKSLGRDEAFAGPWGGGEGQQGEEGLGS